MSTEGGGFRLFSPTHAATLVVVVLFIVVLVVIGRRCSGSAWGRRLEWTLCMAILALRGGVIVWNLRPSEFDWSHSLPLVRPSQWARALTYFWGLALSLQAILTPDIGTGISELAFWVFWLHHALIEGAAFYLIFVKDYRPGWRDLGIAVGLGLAYVALLFPLDALMSYNYGYLGRARPGQPSLIDVLGEWPGRVAVITALGALAMTILLVPWLFVGRRARSLSSRQGVR